jgi:hypothetical protein
MCVGYINHDYSAFVFDEKSIKTICEMIEQSIVLEYEIEKMGTFSLG